MLGQRLVNQRKDFYWQQKLGVFFPLQWSLTWSPDSRTNCLAHSGQALPGASSGGSLPHSVQDPRARGWSPHLGPGAHHRFLSDFPAWPSVFSAQGQPAPAPFPAEGACRQISSPCQEPPSVLDKGRPVWGLLSHLQHTACTHISLFSSYRSQRKGHSSPAYLLSWRSCLCHITLSDFLQSTFHHLGLSCLLIYCLSPSYTCLIHRCILKSCVWDLVGTQ